MNTRTKAERVFVLPAVPEAAQPWSFPVMATLAPVVMSVIIWLITQSIFALLFAALGPIVAAGSFADSRIQARRRARREHQRFLTELNTAREQRHTLHADERAALERRAPSAAQVVDEGARWSAVSRGLTTVTIFLGRGESDSMLEINVPAGTSPVGGARDRAVRDRAVHDRAAHEINELRIAASTLQDAPISVVFGVPGSTEHSSDQRFSEGGSIGIIGRGAVAMAIARSITVQIASVLPPETFSVHATSLGDHWRWLDELPHPTLEPNEEGRTNRSTTNRSTTNRSMVDRGTTITWLAGNGADAPRSTLSITMSERLEDVPHDCDVILDVGGVSGGRMLKHPNHRLLGPVQWETVTLPQALHWARSISALARHEGRIMRDSALPDRVDLATLVGGENDADAAPARSTLACTFSVDQDGPLAIDLVADGPHAIVGGTTGSGKSELLISWVLALAAQYSPAQFTVLLIDFKGGSSFGNLTELPHCVGLLTDLDESTARRALDSLAAEIRFRERTLSAAGARSIEDSPERHRLPRLVIVVDEFAAMANEHPDLHTLFSDIAARGRSLGIHLILCTQRPAGVIREAVFANSGLRISLRVNNRADSTAVIDSDAAARLSARAYGRALLVRSGDEPRTIQCALACADDLNTAASRFADWQAPRRPWLDPLPSILSLGDVCERYAQQQESSLEGVDPSDAPTAIDLPWGVIDLPESQQQPIATWQPQRDGHLLIVGQSRSGKSVAAHTIASAASRTGTCATIVIPASAEAVWDAVTDALAHTRSGHPTAPRLVILDDLDALLPRLSAEHHSEITDRLVQLLREGPASGVHVVVTVQRLTSSLQHAVGLCGSRLILSLASRQDHILAGGAPRHFRERALPGAGSWSDAAVQVAVSGNSPPPELLPVNEFDPTGSFAIVAQYPQTIIGRVREWLTTTGRELEILELGSGASVTANVAAEMERVTVARGEVPRLLIGDPEAWQSQWGALALARSHGPVVVDGCSVGEYRVLTRDRVVPPPLAASDGQFWLLEPHKEAVRARFHVPSPL